MSQIDKKDIDYTQLKVVGGMFIYILVFVGMLLVANHIADSYSEVDNEVACDKYASLGYSVSLREVVEVSYPVCYIRINGHSAPYYEWDIVVTSPNQSEARNIQ